jgi:hypothetical protein
MNKQYLIKPTFLSPSYVTGQNFCYWHQENPCELHNYPLHSTKAMRWCGVMFYTIIRPSAFQNEQHARVTANALCYRDILKNFFTPDTRRVCIKTYGSSHTARICVNMLRDFFRDNTFLNLDTFFWLPGSLDPTFCRTH